MVMLLDRIHGTLHPSHLHDFPGNKRLTSFTKEIRTLGLVVSFHNSNISVHHQENEESRPSS